MLGSIYIRFLMIGHWWRTKCCCHVHVLRREKNTLEPLHWTTCRRISETVSPGPKTHKSAGELFSVMWLSPKRSCAQIFRKGQRGSACAIWLLRCVLRAWCLTDCQCVLVTACLVCPVACDGVLRGWVHHRPREEHQREHAQRRLDSLHLQGDLEGKEPRTGPLFSFSLC